MVKPLVFPKLFFDNILGRTHDAFSATITQKFKFCLRLSLSSVLSFTPFLHISPTHITSHTSPTHSFITASQNFSLVVSTIPISLFSLHHISKQLSVELHFFHDLIQLTHCQYIAYVLHLPGVCSFTHKFSPKDGPITRSSFSFLIRIQYSSFTCRFSSKKSNHKLLFYTFLMTL